MKKINGDSRGLENYKKKRKEKKRKPHRWLIQTTGKKKTTQRTNPETKQGERMEGTRLKQQINVLKGWRGKKKSVQDSIPHWVLYQDTSRQASWPDSSLVDGHASYTQEGLLIDNKCSIGGLAYLSCVCLYMWPWTRTWHGTRLELSTLVHLVWRAFVFTFAGTRLSWPVEFWESSHFRLPSHAEPLEFLCTSPRPAVTRVLMLM